MEKIYLIQYQSMLIQVFFLFELFLFFLEKKNIELYPLILSERGLIAQIQTHNGDISQKLNFSN